MLAQSLYLHLADLLSLQLNKPVKEIFITPIGGGSINQTYRMHLQNGTNFFCKINNARAYPQLFLKEKRGLQILKKAGPIKTPEVLAFSQFEDQQILLLEWIDSGNKGKGFFNLFGEQLAALHQATDNYFGLDEDNYMGSVPQKNNPSPDWSQFFCQQRLQPLVKACFDKHLLRANDLQSFDLLYPKLPHLFSEQQQPALLHGDLWTGNYMCNLDGEPVLIDPAVYYGHPAVDLGMTTLFGALDKAFYESYHYHQPLPANHQEQWAICNLYPLLIHLYLFGSAYAQRIRQTLKAFD